MSDVQRQASARDDTEEWKLQEKAHDVSMKNEVAHPETYKTANEDVLLDPKIYRMTKLVPVRARCRPNDVYVTRSSRFNALVSRVQLLLRRGSVVYIHGMGAALTRCADVAMAVQRAAEPDSLVISASTETVYVVDDYTPLVPGYPTRTRQRAKNVLHVTLTPNKLYV